MQLQVNEARRDSLSRRGAARAALLLAPALAFALVPGCAGNRKWAPPEGDASRPTDLVVVESQLAREGAHGDGACSPTGPFTDVSTSCATAVKWTAGKGLLEAKTPCSKLFGATYELARAEAASSIITLMCGTSFTASSTPYFSDVPATHASFKQIQKLYEAGITAGCGTDSTGKLMFCPSTTATRTQGAAFLVRAKHGVTFTSSETAYYPDVPPLTVDAGGINWGFKFVQRLYEDIGAEADCPGTPGYFCPGTSLLREEWAKLLYAIQTLPSSGC
jgi:hypothetical protein